MQMEIEVFQCPQCGGSLEGVTETGFYSCPYCSSKMKVTLFAPDPNLRPDGRTAIFDSSTGSELCYIKLARGWKATGAVASEMQSANWPFTMRVCARSPDQSVRIDYCSGVSFKEIVACPYARHIEGGYDQTDMMPMRKLQSHIQYADDFMTRSVPGGTKISLLETRPFAKRPPEDFEAKRNELYQGTINKIRYSTPPGMRSSVDKVVYEGITRIYDFEENGQEMRQAVTTFVSGVQISFSAPMMIFGGTSKFMFWDVPYVLTLKASTGTFEQNYENLVMFCSTMQASPRMADLITQERNRIMGYLADRQQRDFEAHQELMRQQQASFDAYNQAWFDRSDITHKSFRSASAAGQSQEDRNSDIVSEGIRGVNTYIRPDGTEVEYSVVNDAVYANANDSHDTFAPQGREFASCDWVEMKKKY